MITEDYVSVETAKLLKEKGFRCDTLHYYYDKDGDLLFSACIVNAGKNEFVAPTLQMAMKWLRKVHHYYIRPMLDSSDYGGHLGYYALVQKIDSESESILVDKMNKVFYDEPEEACEVAIKYCLEDLI